MKKFHRNLNIMSVFTAALLALGIVFWQIFMDIAVSNIVINGIIIGTTLFGICLCFYNMFRLLPEYKWLHKYFEGKPLKGFVPRLLSPISLALNNRHTHITTPVLTGLLDLVSIKIEDERDSVRYITNTLIFLGLLGTFWGLIVTIGGFADLIMNIDFNDKYVMENMQNGLSLPLSGMATAFTSSLLGLAGSLTVGFLGLQLQFAQNTIFQDLSDFMTRYTLQDMDSSKLSASAPVSSNTYTKISEIYNAFANAGYDIRDLIRIDGKHPAVVATGTDEQLFIGTVNIDTDTLQNILKRIELCFADTLEGVHIKTRILCVSGKKSNLDGKVITFVSTDALTKYMSQHKNIKPKTVEGKETFAAYVEYIDTAIQYLFKPNK